MALSWGASRRAKPGSGGEIDAPQEQITLTCGSSELSSRRMLELTAVREH
jgi:hypothetical protein